MAFGSGGRPITVEGVHESFKCFNKGEAEIREIVG